MPEEPWSPTPLSGLNCLAAITEETRGDALDVDAQCEYWKAGDKVAWTVSVTGCDGRDLIPIVNYKTAINGGVTSNVLGWERSMTTLAHFVFILQKLYRNFRPISFLT